MKNLRMHSRAALVALAAFLFAVPAVVQAGVDAVLVVKNQAWVQTGPDAMSFATEEPWSYNATLLVDDQGINNATLTFPDGSTQPFAQDAGSDTWNANEDYATKAELDAAFPNTAQGENYLIEWEFGATGIGGAQLGFAEPGLGYPNVPKVVNYEAAQNIDPAQPFTLEWEPFANAVGGLTADSLIVLEIQDLEGNSVFRSELTDIGSILTGADTSVEIPAGTFAEGMTYRVGLGFVRPVAALLLNDPIVVVGVSSATALEIQTIGGAPANIFAGAEDLGGGWKRLAWFGDFNDEQYPWIYHAQHGFAYIYDVSTLDNLFFFGLGGMGTVWTTDAIYPSLYFFDGGHAWTFYQGVFDGVRVFTRFSDEESFTLPLAPLN